MLENEIRVVNDLINVRKRHSIVENELHRMCREFNANLDVVLIILREKYNGRYIPSSDSHCCGDYAFDNPNLQKKDHFVLNYLFKNESKPGHSFRVEADDKKCYETLAREILRLEDENIETSLKDIIIALRDQRAFIGIKRIWFITTRKSY